MAGQATLSQVQSLYVAYYGRPADPDGLDFWANVVEANGGDLNVIIKDFGSAPEYQQRFGNLDNNTLVNNLYQQMFGRDAEPGGLEFWAGLLKAGTQNLGQIAQTIASLASEIDLQVLNGRVTLADAFTTSLSTSAEALANYNNTHGIEVGRDFLNQVTGTTVGNISALTAKAGDAVATLPPTTGGGTGGGPPAPTFLTAIGSHELSFTGTATGDITVVESVNAVTFTRGGVTVQLQKTVFDTVSSVTSSTALTINVSGSASVALLTSLKATNDATTVTTHYTSIADTIDHLLVSTPIQLPPIPIPVLPFNLELVNSAPSAPEVATPFITSGINVTITGDATVSQIAILDEANGSGNLSYSISDTVGDLFSTMDSNTLNEYVKAGVKVTITDAATLDQIKQIDAHNDSAAVVYTNIADTAVNIKTNLALVNDGVDVVVTGQSSIADLNLIVGSKSLNVQTVEDTIGHLIGVPATDPNVISFITPVDTPVVSKYITVETSVVVTDAATVAQIEQLNAEIIDGNLTFSLADSAANLLDTVLVSSATSTTVTGSATLDQLNQLSHDNYSFTYSSVTGSANDLISAADNDIWVTNGKNVLVTGNIDVADLNLVKTVIGSGSVVAADVADSAENLVIEGKVTSYIAAGTNVTVNAATTVSNIALLDAANNGLDGETGTLTYSLIDTYSTILANTTVSSGADSISLSDSNLGKVTVKQVQDLLSLTNTTIHLADLAFTLDDTLTNLTASAATDILAQAITATANSALTVVQAITLHELKGADAIYDIIDSAANLAAGTDANGTIAGAVNLKANTTATAAEATVIHDRDGAGDAHYSVLDNYESLVSPANLLALNAAENVTVIANMWLNASNANQIAALSNTGLTTIPLLWDNAANIDTFVSANHWSENLHYNNMYVQDTAAGIMTEVNNDRTSFITGISDIEGEAHPATQVYVTDPLSIANSNIFWTAVSNVPNASSITYYSVTDTIANYTNDNTDSAGVTNADVKTVTGSATEIAAAQAQPSPPTIFSKLTGNDHIDVTSGSDGSQNITGSEGTDTILGGAGNDTLNGGAGNDHIDGGADYDTIHGNDGDDTIYGGTGSNTLYGDAGRDIIFAGESASITTYIYNAANVVIGGAGSDQMYGSNGADTFKFVGTTFDQLVAESGTQQSNRDYITNFSTGDKITFEDVSSIQFFGTGSATATTVDANTVGLSIRYEKNADASQWDGTQASSTRVFIDVSKNGVFDGVADMNIILVGSIDINQAGNNSLTYGA
jgi:hypothetical protein